MDSLPHSIFLIAAFAVPPHRACGHAAPVHTFSRFSSTIHAALAGRAAPSMPGPHHSRYAGPCRALTGRLIRPAVRFCVLRKTN